MSDIVKIEEQLKDAMAEYKNVEEELKSCRERLDELWKGGEEKHEEREYLINEKKLLEENKFRWEVQFINLQNKLTEFGEWKGNEQIV